MLANFALTRRIIGEPALTSRKTLGSDPAFVHELSLRRIAAGPSRQCPVSWQLMLGKRGLDTTSRGPSHWDGLVVSSPCTIAGS